MRTLIGRYLTASLLVASLCHAQTTWYVDDNNCPGPGRGTPEDPFCKIQDGLDAAQDGDTVLIKDGVYSGEGNKDLRVGARPITIRSENGPDSCTIDGSYQGDGFIFNAANTEARVEGLTITNFSTGFELVDHATKGLTFTISNCVIESTGSFVSSYGEITDSTISIDNCTASGSVTLGEQRDGQSQNITGLRLSITDSIISRDVVLRGHREEREPTEITDSTISLRRSEIKGEFRFDSNYNRDSDSAIRDSIVSIEDCEIAGEFRFQHYYGNKWDIEDSVISVKRSSISIDWGYETFFSRTTISISDSEISDGIVGGKDFSDGTISVTGCTFTDGGLSVSSIEGSRIDITNSVFTGGDVGESGISCTGGWESIRVSDCTVTDSGSRGLRLSGEVVVVTNCTSARIQYLGADLNGSVSLLVSDCIFTDTVKGRGLKCSGGNVVIERCLVADNASGGIECSGWPTIITGCTITGNTTDFGGTGGGILFRGAGGRIENSIISGNAAYAGGMGGGIYFEKSVGSRIVNCLITDNWARFGGGIYCESSVPTITNCTLANNESDAGGAIYSFESNPLVSNSILWDNWPEEIFVESGPALVDHSDIQGGWRGEGNIDVDPLFADPRSGNYRLRQDSQCTEQGDNEAVPPYATVDLDGNIRIVDGNGSPGGNVDMGAYEYGAPSACTGKEKLKAKCKDNNGVNRLTVKLKKGQPGATLTIRLDGDRDSDVYATVRNNGRAKHKTTDLLDGSHVVELVECRKSKETDCP